MTRKSKKAKTVTSKVTRGDINNSSRKKIFRVETKSEAESKVGSKVEAKNEDKE